MPSEGTRWHVEHADCVEAMRDMDEASVDAIVCDPPYGLEFMGKEWDRLADTPGYNERGRITDRPDSQVPYGRGGGVNSYQAGRPMQEWHQAWATEALRVLKPGGHLLAFGGTRTYHRLACAVEDAGFEIRDSLIWLYGSGFPKSLNLGNGWGTALKPAHEPIVVARKPLSGTVAENVQAHGTGALNIDGCRIEGTPRATGTVNPHAESGVNGIYGSDLRTDRQQTYDANLPAGRWPANCVLSHLPECEEDACAESCAVAELDRQSGELHSQDPRTRDAYAPRSGVIGFADGGAHYADRGGASRFFYTAKASRSERNAGLDGGRCTHPTVKPIELMRWLCRLVTPPEGTILDPFVGSGTTGCAAVLEGFDFIGIEREAEYVDIARARIEWWAQHQGKEADEVLAITRRSEAVKESMEAMGQSSLFAMNATPVDGSREGEASAERRYTESGASNFAMKPGRRRKD